MGTIILYNLLGMILLFVGMRKEERIIVILGAVILGMSYGKMIFSDITKEPEKKELRIEGYYQNDSTFVVTDSTIVFKR